MVIVCSCGECVRLWWLCVVVVVVCGCGGCVWLWWLYVTVAIDYLEWEVFQLMFVQ